MNKQKTSNSFKILVVFGVLLFALIAFIVVRATATVNAVVPNQAISAGTKIDSSMLQTIEIPVNTPKGYITDISSVVGQKLKVSVGENQLLYINDIMLSWDDFSDGKTIPDDYIVTSIQLPSNRAVGGLITAGDTVDILGIPNSEYNTTSKETLNNYLGDISKSSYGANGMNVYWILSNVRILETDSTLSQSNESSISSVTNEKNSSNEGSFYIVALSYDDYKKLRLSEQYLDIWMNISPAQNESNDPLIDAMNESVIKELQDSQSQSKIKIDEKTEENAGTDTKVEN